MSLALVSQKGGVGKTTLAANLAASFADLKFRTLLVEIDPQGSLIQCFGLDRFDLSHGLYGCTTAGKPADAAVERDLAENLDLLPANIWSHEEEHVFVGALEMQPTLLRTVLEPLKDRYDYLVLDCPPALGPLTRAALTAADRYLVPVQAEALNLATIGRLENLAADIRGTLNPDLEREGLVVSMADTRTRHAGNIIERLSKEYPRDLLQTIIPRSIRVADDAGRGRPTVMTRARTRAGEAFQDLAEEILARHSRERAAEAAEQAGEPAPETEMWRTVLEEFPDDPDLVEAPATGNGHGVPSGLRRWELE